MAQKLSGQLYVNGGFPVEAGKTPLETVEELASVPMNCRYIGLTVTVMNSVYDEDPDSPTYDELISQNPVDYWLVGGIQNPYWRVKAGNIVPNKTALNSISSSACTLGLEMVVQQDESNEGKVTKYWVTAIDGENVTWSQKQYGGGSANVIVDGEDLESE